jgi:hypothetical protein
MIKKYFRAEVTPEFIHALQTIARTKIARYADEAKFMPERSKKLYVSRKAPVVAKLNKLRTDDGRDYEITRLRSLDFIRYEVLDHEGSRWLVAHTRDILMTRWDGERQPGENAQRWNMGPYTIYIPVDDFISGSTIHFHFVPDREPLTMYRHPHHKGYLVNIITPASPLQMDPSTCWGSFGTIVTGCVTDGDVVETFRALHAYLSRYNVRSPLGGGVEYCNFAQQIGGR